MSGFLGMHATFKADFNLIAQLVMGMALVGGMVLARRKMYRIHMFCQSTVMLVNLLLIAIIMAPSFFNFVEPQLPSGLHDPYYYVATAHAAMGVLAQGLGLYIVAVAATPLVPQRFRFHNYKLWMRTQLVLWWIVLGLGIGVYDVWYVSPA